MKNALKLALGLFFIIVIGLNLTFTIQSNVLKKGISLESIISSASATPEAGDCSHGGISGHDENPYLCECGIWTTGCLAVINYCCNATPDCSDCDDPVEV